MRIAPYHMVLEKAALCITANLAADCPLMGRTNALQQTAHSSTSSACASKVGAVSADGIASSRRQDCAGLQHIDLALVSQRVRQPDSRCALHPCDLNLP